MDFRITGLSPGPFRHLFGLPDHELKQHRALRVFAEDRGYPDRIEMCEAEIGESLLLLNHVCQSAETPYYATHAIYVRENAVAAYDRINEVPSVMRTRLLSLRAYNATGMIIGAEVVQGTDIEAAIERLFSDQNAAYIHAHNAGRGCYSGRIDRA
ncbi:hypothetical protein HNQ68_001425 [Pseudochrobactrum saccharolyticum]|uniref:DUF1203 domain-containing protein n=1 Tax=Pseudochrobactrum saccharolyticum TaxID=354352 RepID=A0A7W8EPK1_9HYPH|nr:DUF1203 domain-containing protein [Pseudochrobactrum saccharolyticum]KAB0539089.1 DUF1203 domain-containing protein [Pseudochrobactrum saccharolyticum]MBB5090901.1 hypothetical protein [Pseudochrobactrum saccharolyticum]